MLSLLNHRIRLVDPLFHYQKHQVPAKTLVLHDNLQYTPCYMNRVTLSITLEPSVLAKLPARNKSGVINEVLKTHFQKGDSEQLVQAIKQALLDDSRYLAQLRDALKATVEPCPLHPNKQKATCPFFHGVTND